MARIYNDFIRKTYEKEMEILYNGIRENIGLEGTTNYRQLKTLKF